MGSSYRRPGLCTVRFISTASHIYTCDPATIVYPTLHSQKTSQNPAANVPNPQRQASPISIPPKPTHSPNNVLLPINAKSCHHPIFTAKPPPDTSPPPPPAHHHPTHPPAQPSNHLRKPRSQRRGGGSHTHDGGNLPTEPYLRKPPIRSSNPRMWNPVIRCDDAHALVGARLGGA